MSYQRFQTSAYHNLTSSLHRVISTRMERVTTEQSTYRHAAATNCPVAGNGVNGVFRTCGNESARRG